MKNIYKYLIGLLVIIIIVIYAIFYSKSSPVIAPPPVSSGMSDTSSVGTSTGSTQVAYKDGTYTGKVADAYYGNLQVEAIISGGKLTDVKFLEYPTSGAHSVQVNEEAIPTLTSEAIAAQSANVDIVSGATQSSQAFQESLSDALSQAQS